MSRMRLGKKLQPAKKAWNSFSNTVQYKLHKLNIPKSFKTTLQRLLSAFHSFGHLIHSKLHRSLTTTRPRATTYYHVQHKHCAAIHIDDLFDKANSVSMHATNNRSAHAQGQTSKGKEKEEHSILKGNLVGECYNQSHTLLKRNLTYECTNQNHHSEIIVKRSLTDKHRSQNQSGESSGLNTIEDAWKVVVAKSPQLHVDQKAEEFISKFREDMRLQKERSMLEFQEMLARSA
ncbi:hypothetical protein LR48_Vigan02g008000 [Vigna angularis]|uniref:DUF761 domain-containing protein n=2 Tax=Phaseolus angularis TaxID=3914 RepID=A0A0L9TTQ8_PHAAN|nr:uncharacterized protein LOC108325350 [Vigna angularis]KAG2403628.1 uncharacterized protein HKW66_Vig0189150 [Vigna angularis]KOM33930.1 hypothetical protein LR48_Vigan02g008000 [Vigna angularis]BAT96635.1 hypothetical protein VIGAN_08360600 [Vigna angularis var. angularis]